MHTLNNQTVFSADTLKLDAAMVVDRMVSVIRKLMVQRTFRTPLEPLDSILVIF